MNAIASLDPQTLAHRLEDLVGEELNVQVDFLLHLDEFDRRRAYLEAGYGSLWEYCQRALHLREGAAWRRIACLRVLRRFPRVEAPLRDGRLCLSTLALLGPVLTEANADEFLSRVAHRSKAEVDSLVASVRPRPALGDGIRKLPEPRPEASAPSLSPDNTATRQLAPTAPAALPTDGEPDQVASAPVPALSMPPRHDEPRAEMRAVSDGRWSLRVSIDREFKEDLERLAMLASHKVPRGDLAALLHEAIRCGIEKHGKRKGAVAPSRKRSPKPRKAQPRDSRAIPVEVRRQVWARDGGRCTWEGPDGRRCQSRWQLELDHITPPLFGGGATADNLRLRCKPHNLLYAEQVYGREHMDRFRRRSAPNG